MPISRLSASLLFLFASPLLAAEVDYVKDVKPLLALKCTACHGALKQKADLRLDAGKLIHRGGESGKVLSAGKAAESLILKKVTATDPQERMPPEGEGEPLTPEQVATLKAWIEAGAKFPVDEVILQNPREHWAYQVPVRPAVPVMDGAAWTLNPIDAFIAARQRERKLAPLPEADRATLLRRVYLDLVGLPPTREQLHAFLADHSPTAYEQVVDELLASPQYGERWGRHWMDIWRYSDWYGQGKEIHGSQRHMWRWRDWIIESLNRDQPYDRMIVEMLAGDEVAPEDPDTVRATAFLARNFFLGNRDLWLDKSNSRRSFLGMTINCAKCHDHKYDPLLQVDYYQARAIFEPYGARIDRLPGQLDVERDGIARVYDATPATETFLYMHGNEKHPDKSRPIKAALPAFFGVELAPTPVELPLFAYAPDLQEFVLEETLAVSREAARRAAMELMKAQGKAGELPLLKLKLVEAEAALASTEARIAADRARHASPPDPRREELAKAAAKAEHVYSVAVAKVAVHDAERALEAAQGALKKDDSNTKSAVDAAAKTLAEMRTKLAEAEVALENTDSNYTPVGLEFPKTSTGRRLGLARWIVDRRNPLTARVAVNHIWMRHFGTPLVERAFNFGLNSPRPLHHELLDWLAMELMENEWRMKPLHRLLVTSRTYQLASGEASIESEDMNAPSKDNNTQRSNHSVSLDPENRLYWRSNVRRLDAEVVRDSILHLPGSLDQTFGGPDIDFNLGEKGRRRSLYFQHAYEKQVRLLVLFDAANPVDCYRRTESIVPQQALALANSPLALTQARRLARSLSLGLANTAAADDEFIVAAFEQTLTRRPAAVELVACREFLTEQRKRLADKASLTPFERSASVELDASADPRLIRISQRHAAMFAADMTPEVAASDDPALRARENLVHVLINHNDFVTVR